MRGTWLGHGEEAPVAVRSDGDDWFGSVPRVQVPNLGVSEALQYEPYQISVHMCAPLAQVLSIPGCRVEYAA